MLQIGQFSKLARTTVKTLRYYDKIGLLKPVMIDEGSHYRYYSEEQLETVRRIALYKKAGMSNDAILQIINESGNRNELLQSQRKLLLERAEEIRYALAALDGLLEGELHQTYEATVKHVEKRLVYCCRGYVANADGIHDFIKASAAELERSNPEVRFSEPDYCCVIYPDDGYRESDIFIEYAQSVDRIAKNTETVKFKEIEPITAISVIHRGKYDTLRDAYLFAVSWAVENGHTLAGEPRERYIHGAWDRKDESEWVTELQLPIKET